MRKSLFFKIVMLLTVVVLAVNCKDYDDDISKLDTGLTAQKKDLEKQLAAKSTELNNALNAVKAASEAKDLDLSKMLGAVDKEVKALKADAATKAELAAKVKELKDAAAKRDEAVDAKLAELAKDLAGAATKTELTAAVKDLKEVQAANKKAIEAELTKLSEKVSKAATKEEVKKEVDAVKATLKELADKDAELKLAMDKAVKDLTKKITDQGTTFDDKVKALVKDLKKVEGDVTDVTKKLTEFVTKVEETYATKVELTKMEADLKDLIKKAQDKADANATDIASNTTLINEAKEAIGKAVGRIGAAETRLDAIDGENGKIATLTADLAKVEGDVTTLEAGLKALKAVALTDESPTITKIQKKLVELEEAKVATEEKLSDYGTRIAALETTAATLGTDVETLKTDVATLKTDVAKLQTDLTALQGKVDEGLNLLKIDINKVLDGRLTSLVFAPDLYVDGIEAIDFRPLVITCGKEEVVLNREVVATYHLNPSSVAEAMIMKDKLGVAFRTVKSISTKSGEKAPFTVSYKGIENGVLTVGLTAAESTYVGVKAAETKGEIGVLALQVPHSAKAMLDVTPSEETVEVNGESMPKNAVVTSDYARAYMTPIKGADLKIAYPADTENKYTCADVNGLHKTALTDIKALTVKDAKVVQVPYNGSVDLLEKVATVLAPTGKACNYWTNEDLAAYKLKYVFDLNDDNNELIKYELGDNKTDQQEFIKLNGSTASAKVFTQQDETYAAVGRTPIVRVRLMSDDCTVSSAYIKLNIVKEPQKYDDITVPAFPFGPNKDMCADFTGGITVQQMNEQVYNAAKLSKDEFHKLYELDITTHAATNSGTVVETPDNTEMTSHVLNWTITSDDLWASETGEFEYKVIYKAKNDDRANIIMTMTTKFSAAKYDITSIIPSYWNDAKTFVIHNVAVPDAGSIDHTKATFANNINAAFTTNADKKLEVPAGITKYEYVFAPVAQQIKAKDAEGNDITIVVSADGKTLSGKVGAGAEEVLATITDFAANVGDLLTYSETPLAKYLLNKDKSYMWAKLQIKASACNNPARKVEVTVNGKEYFTVSFVRPINVADISDANFIDGVDFGKPGSVLDVLDIVALSDWRAKEGDNGAYSFKKNDNYYKYYNVSAIEADLTKVTANFGNGYVAKPSTLEMTQTPATAEAPYGTITYKNNGSGVQKAFTLRIPVKVTYKWGEIVSAVIEVPVAKTVGQ